MYSKINPNQLSQNQTTVSTEHCNKSKVKIVNSPK